MSKIVVSQGVKVMAEYAVKNDSSAIKLRYGLVQWVSSCFDVCACVCVWERKRERQKLGPQSKGVKPQLSHDQQF